MRRHPSHYLSPARANARQGKTPKPAAAAPSHHSNAPNKPESQSILSKIVAHWIDGLPPDPGRACLLLSGHWLKAARHLRFQSTISRFESSRPSQAVRRSEKMSLILAERPANGGLLRISQRSPGSNFRHSQSEIADSLRQTFEKLPFLGDCGRRPDSICTAWPSWQCNPRISPP
jgi:hypothetical protein